jgi:hypothetical protein
VGNSRQVADCLPNIHKALGLTHSITGKKGGEKKGTISEATSKMPINIKPKGLIFQTVQVCLHNKRLYHPNNLCNIEVSRHMNNTSLIRIVTTNPPLYNEYIPIKNVLKKKIDEQKTCWGGRG